MTVHLKKLCVGAKDVRDLFDRQKMHRDRYKETIHVTRMFPKQHEDLINGGSIYWIFRGYIRARQNILDIKKFVSMDKVKRCKILLSDEIMLTAPKKSRPFQGWRYLKNKDIPKDDILFNSEKFDNYNEDLKAELSKLGLI